MIHGEVWKNSWLPLNLLEHYRITFRADRFTILMSHEGDMYTFGTTINATRKDGKRPTLFIP